MSLATLTFYYTLIVMFCIVFAAASCASGLLVSHRKSFAFGIVIFAVYFFDISTVFFHDFVSHGTVASASSPFDIQYPQISLITGVLVFGALWLYVCERLHLLQNKMLALAPPAAFFALSACMLVFVSDPQLKCFLFFSCRQLFAFFIFGVYFARYFHADEGGRQRMRPKPADVAIAFALSVGVLVEDVVVIFFILPNNLSGSGILPTFFAERSLCENLLFIWLGYVLARDALGTVGAHFSNPPDGSSETSAATIEEILPRYCDLHELTPREREILRLVLQGKDNRNIASELSLALGTVKVHIHNILHKTENANRQELIQDFWKVR